MWGSSIYVIGTVLTHVACTSLQSGESLLGLLLFIPWVAAFFPLSLGYRLFGLGWRVGEFRGIKPEMLLAAATLNFILGALLGAALWKSWQLSKRLFTKHRRS